MGNLGGWKQAWTWFWTGQRGHLVVGTAHPTWLPEDWRDS